MKKTIINESQGVSNVVMRMYQEIKNILTKGETTDKQSGEIVNIEDNGNARTVELRNFFFISWIKVTALKNGNNRGGTGVEDKNQDASTLYQNMFIKPDGRIAFHNADGSEFPFFIISEYSDVVGYGSGEARNDSSMSSVMAHELMHVYRFYVKLKNTKDKGKMMARETGHSTFYQKCMSAINNPNTDDIVRLYSYFNYIIDEDEISAEQQGGYAYQMDSTVGFSKSNLMERYKELKDMFEKLLRYEGNIKEWTKVFEYFNGQSHEQGVEHLMDSFYRKGQKAVERFAKLGKRQLRKVAGEKLSQRRGEPVEYGYTPTWNDMSNDKAERLRRLQALRDRTLANRDKIKQGMNINEVVSRITESILDAFNII